MTLSEFVTDYRKSHGLSQRQFASICELSNGYISMLERGENPNTQKPLTPSLSALNKITRGMGISMYDFFANVDDMLVIPNGQEKTLLENYCSLNDEGQEYIANQMNYALYRVEFKKDNQCELGNQKQA